MEMFNKGDFVSKRKSKRKTTSTRAKKKKPTSYTSDDVLLASSWSSLPDDLLVMIVARVPILYYRTLSLVSKSFRSMVASPELYKVRSLLGLTESCLYVCLRFGAGPYEWYTLSPKSSGGYVLARVPIPDDDSRSVMHLGSSDIVAVGSDIYKIGQADKTTSTSVSILDCKSHMWRKAPSMPMELESLSAIVLDRNIFVLGRHNNEDGDSWKSSLQVFNTNTQTWDIPRCLLDLASHTFTIGGNLHAVNLSGWVFAFNSKQGRWDQLFEIDPSVGEIMYSESYCEIDNVLYSVSKDGALRWYDTDQTRWRDLKGLVGLPKLPSRSDGCGGSYVKLTGYGGGKMMVFWSFKFSILLSYIQTIYCAEITLERRKGDCWGKLEWYDGVLSVLAGTEFVKILSVTL